ncbi:hypothetical protein T4C_13191 [Trichinella pseudospiralis]|uniref:Uncharacterized protein n=1 Tax=Trichinella pseudospiralis TaxID=6337 RepID=A0A0V1IUK5_TRIPS|nr:hypothetical protein T4C_13191 [Trichinella pseudospiralis]
METVLVDNFKKFKKLKLKIYLIFFERAMNTKLGRYLWRKLTTTRGREGEDFFNLKKKRINYYHCLFVIVVGNVVFYWPNVVSQSSSSSSRSAKGKEAYRCEDQCYFERIFLK